MMGDAPWDSCGTLLFKCHLNEGSTLFSRSVDLKRHFSFEKKMLLSFSLNLSSSNRREVVKSETGLFIYFILRVICHFLSDYFEYFSRSSRAQTKYCVGGYFRQHTIQKILHVKYINN